MPRYRLLLEYDGGGFCGWQRQANGVAVQQVVEEAIHAFADESVTLTAAGRTDAGVHARGQSVHFDLARPKSVANIVEGINFHLKKTVKCRRAAVLSAKEVGGDFNARFSATSRYYRYFIWRHRRSPLLDERAWCLDYPLNIAAMRAAAGLLQGEHDFSAFRAAGCQAKSPIKTLDRLAVHPRGELLVITARARSFLYNQVRILAAVLVEVGRGRFDLQRVKALLVDGKRTSATAPPRGLYLWRVSY